MMCMIKITSTTRDKQIVAKVFHNLAVECVEEIYRDIIPRLVLMYRKSELPSTPPENFELPFEGKLSQDNRWVIIANLIPWSEFEAEYASLFSEEMGTPAKTFRTALGALIINALTCGLKAETDV